MLSEPEEWIFAGGDGPGPGLICGKTHGETQRCATASQARCGGRRDSRASERCPPDAAPPVPRTSRSSRRARRTRRVSCPAVLASRATRSSGQVQLARRLACNAVTRQLQRGHVSTATRSRVNCKAVARHVQCARRVSSDALGDSLATRSRVTCNAVACHLQRARVSTATRSRVTCWAPRAPPPPEPRRPHSAGVRGIAPRNPRRAADERTSTRCLPNATSRSARRHA